MPLPNRDAQRAQQWHTAWASAALRVAKPGAFLLAFGGTRTFHRLACALEDAGWEIRDTLCWLYGSGFPKSLDISKAIDKRRDDRLATLGVTNFVAAARDQAKLTNRAIDEHFCFNGMASHWTSRESQASIPTWEQWLELKNLCDFGDEMDAEVWRLNGRKGKPGESWHEREVLGERLGAQSDSTGRFGGWGNDTGDGRSRVVDTAPATAAAREWSGWGTALKPAWEPIIVAMKPLDGTFAANAQKWGVAGLNIDAARIESASGDDCERGRIGGGGLYGPSVRFNERQSGRWPANVALDEIAAQALDEMSGERKAGGDIRPRDGYARMGFEFAGGNSTERTFGSHADSGGASRFFFTAKASRSEREEGLEGELVPGTFGHKRCAKCGRQAVNVSGTCKCPEPEWIAGAAVAKARNHHPTVKPLALMEWLCKLTSTPTAGVILDPFAGSGTTLLAARNTGRRCIGIEREPEYVQIACGRLKTWQPTLFDAPEPAPAPEPEDPEWHQPSLAL